MGANETVRELVHGRHNPLIDPSLHVWGWKIPVYLFLGGLAGGLLVLAAVLELRRGRRPEARVLRLAPLGALLLLSAGMLALFLDLAYKSHVYRFFLSFEPTSPMSWGSWILLLVYPVGLLLGLGSFTGEERERLARRVPRPARGWLDRAAAIADRRRVPLLWSSATLGAALGTYTGLLLGTLTARPLWNTSILGPLFLVSGLSTAAALLLLFRAEGEEGTLVRWDIALIGVELFLLFLMLLDLATGSEAHRWAANELLGGKWTGVFWALVVLTGLLCPMAMKIAEIKRHLRPTVVAPILVLVGGLSLRWILLLAGEAGSYGFIR